jgi:hypothetical protein
MDVLRVELSREAGDASHIGEHDRHQLTLPFQGTTRGQDLIGQVFGGVGFRLPVVNGGEFFQFSQFEATFKTEFAVRMYILAPLRTNRFDFLAAFFTELGPLWQVGLTLGTDHSKYSSFRLNFSAIMGRLLTSRGCVGMPINCLSESFHQEHRLPDFGGYTP